MKPLEWFDTLLKSRSLSRPDERPLYRYRVTDQEFTELTKTLKLSVNLGANNIHKMLMWDAAFVIYVSEWWRRYYSGQWGWEGVFDSIGISMDDWSVLTRNSLVESGLHRWKRKVRVINDKRHFLGTLATEGGLPLNQLKDSGGWLKGILQPVLRKHLSRGIDVGSLISGYRDLIPRSYQSNEMDQILSDMVYTIVTLRKEFGLKDKESPIEWLDSQSPNWRELFPLPMDDAQARSLLSELIDTASRTSEDKKSASAFELERYIVRLEVQSPELCARLTVPSFVSLEKLGIDPDRNDIPSTLDIDVYSNDGSSCNWCKGIVTSYREQRSVKLVGKAKIFNGEEAAKEWRLRVKHAGEIFSETQIVNGDQLDGTMPWLFKLEDSLWQLFGTASQSVKSTVAMVYVPSNCIINEPSDNASVVGIGNFMGGMLYKLEGSIFLDSTDDRYVLSSGIEESVFRYDLEGKRIFGSVEPSVVYVGVPELKEINTVTGAVVRKGSSNLLGKPIGVNGDWIPVNSLGPGLHEVRYQTGSQGVLLRKRIGILPADFSYSICPNSQNVKAGALVLAGISGLNVSVKEDSVTCNAVPKNDQISLNLLTNQPPPRAVCISLVPKARGREIVLEIPYPSKGALVFDQNGKPVPISEPLYIERLMGQRIKLYVQNASQNQVADLSFQLIDEKMTNEERRDIRIKKKIRISGQVMEFSPYDWVEYVDAMIGVGSNLDAAVKIELVLHSQVLFAVTVKRYQTELEPDFIEGTVAFDRRTSLLLDVDELSNTHISTIYLNQPEQHTSDLVPIRNGGIDTGTWSFDLSHRAAGLWVIYPTADSVIQFRPFLWVVGDDKGVDPDEQLIDTLSKAVRVVDESRRRQEIQNVLRLMVSDSEHKSWIYLKNLWEKTKHLPLYTFDVWRVAINEPTFLAALFFKKNEGLIDRVLDELPILWEAVTLADWVKLFVQYRARMEPVLEDRQMCNELIENRIAQMESLGEELKVVAVLLRRELLGRSCPELASMARKEAKQMMKLLVREELQGLLRRKSESNWPNYMHRTIVQKYADIPQNLAGIIPDPLDHQKSIAFLPFVLAWLTVNGADDKWPSTPAELFKLHQLKEFDQDWFCAVYGHLVGYFSQQI